MTEPAEPPTEGTSLIRAVYQRRLRLTRLLLEGGAYVNESNERGETPLMIACRTKHLDPQSVSKAKMVKYLLENSADPNIQDTSGKTALIHACQEKAGPEVVSLLLKSGADPSLQDHTCRSALVYALNNEDIETLKILLSACKEQGKEVIIITTEVSPLGRQKTREYINTLPADLEECCSSATCTSPSDIKLKISPSPLSSSKGTQEGLFSFKELHLPRRVERSSQAASPTRKRSSAKVGPKMAQIQRLQSEPWAKRSPSALNQKRIASLQDNPPGVTTEEKLSFKINGFSLWKKLITKNPSIDIKDRARLLKTLDQPVSKKLPHDERNSWIPSAKEKHKPSVIPKGKDTSLEQINFLSNLSSIIQRRNFGANHYSSDSQITAEERKSATRKKKVHSPAHSLRSNSRGAVENLPPIALSRGNPSVLQRQSSGALSLNHAAQTRPGFLPPLSVNPHPPAPNNGVFINKFSGVLSCEKTHLPP
ncbi:AN34B protein, partial [Oreotrochilus melanogaster]|nr:AN34B protein [Oreotrochilus melanogaster]